jgi:hypothetical protein
MGRREIAFGVAGVTGTIGGALLVSATVALGYVFIGLATIALVLGVWPGLLDLRPLAWVRRLVVAALSGLRRLSLRNPVYIRPTGLSTPPTPAPTEVPPPPPAVPLAPPPRITPEDRVAIAAIRGLWKVHGTPVADQLQYLGDRLEYLLEARRWPYHKYFKTTLTAHTNARTAWTKAIDPEFPSTLTEVQGAFVAWFSTYKDLAYEIARIRKAEDGILRDRSDYIIGWRTSHAKFYEKMEEVCNGWPEHEHLKVGYGPAYFFFSGDTITRDFVFGEEPNPRLLDSDTEEPPPPVSGASHP